MSSRWQDDFFALSLQRVRNNQPLPEDVRTADWSYLLPLPPDRPLETLIIGGGWGAVPIRLAQWCEKVWVLDEVSEKSSLLRKRKEQGGIDPVEIIDSSDIQTLPFRDNSLDLICLHRLPNRWKRDLGEVLAVIHRLLKKDGIVALNVGNRWSLQSLLRNGHEEESFVPKTLPGYQKELRRAGFRNISVYGPIPHHRGIPLFYLPLQNRRGLHFFFKNIFPLFEMVSPESKKAYALEYRIAKLGVRIGQLLHLTWLARYFLSGFLLIARKEAQPI